MIEEVIAQLIDDKYIDDMRYAVKVLRNRSGRNSEGRAKLRARLEASGIPDSVIHEVLSRDEYADENTIMEVISDRYPPESFSSDPKTAKKELVKAVRYLESRGYSSSLALASFRKIVDDVE